ncbi:hypothetical protein [Niveibacterium sp.]|uniref:hypothetical protein n=1 Tax=Niveibacterium sp. TaxID=2017444 RepID=UPI0035B0CA9F
MLSCKVSLLALASLGVATCASGTEYVREQTLTVRPDDPQLKLRAQSDATTRGTDTLGMSVDFGKSAAGSTSFATEALSTGGGGPRLDSLRLDHDVDFGKFRLGPVPLRLDMGMRLDRQFDDDARWGMGLRPRVHSRIGRLTMDADISVEREPMADLRKTEMNYAWRADYEYRPALSFGIAASGSRRVDESLLNTPEPTLTPRVSGRYLLDDGVLLRYGVGMAVDTARNSTSPDLKVGLELKF